MNGVRGELEDKDEERQLKSFYNPFDIKWKSFIIGNEVYYMQCCFIDKLIRIDFTLI